MKSTIVTILLLFQLAVFGCHSQSSNADIIGTWECINFKKVSHVSHFKQCFIRFDPNGITTSWFINNAGDRVEQPPFRYHYDGQKMWGDKNTNTIWSILIHDDTMTITTVQDPNPDNVGFTLEHRRVRE